MSNRPAKSFRIGNVKATIWPGESGHYNSTFVRSYKDNGGQWQDGGSFSHHDLLNLSKVAERAEAWIADQADEQ